MEYSATIGKLRKNAHRDIAPHYRSRRARLPNRHRAIHADLVCPSESPTIRHFRAIFSFQHTLAPLSLPVVHTSVTTHICMYYSVIVLRVEWDETKNKINQSKHDIDFETAKLVFDDPCCIVFIERVTGGEERWHAIGTIEKSSHPGGCSYVSW